MSEQSNVLWPSAEKNSMSLFPSKYGRWRKMYCMNNKKGNFQKSKYKNFSANCANYMIKRFNCLRFSHIEHEQKKRHGGK